MCDKMKDGGKHFPLTFSVGSMLYLACTLINVQTGGHVEEGQGKRKRLRQETEAEHREAPCTFRWGRIKAAEPPSLNTGENSSRNSETSGLSLQGRVRLNEGMGNLGEPMALESNQPGFKPGPILDQRATGMKSEPLELVSASVN